MKIIALRLAVACLVAIFAVGLMGCESDGATSGRDTMPQVYLTDAPRLALARNRAVAGDEQLEPALEALIGFAEQAIHEPMRSVTEKPNVPDGGTINDYVSLSPYWWPNPETDDGLPYVRRDGEINPERDQYDMPALDTFGKTVRWLGFAYYFTGDQRYADAAVKRIDHFLLNPQTRMTPRMQFGQFIPGVNNGRKYGIIETLRLRWVPDAISLLEGADAMTPQIMADTKQWFGDYARWLNSSEFGIAERDGPNNHGTWATAQIAYYAAFAGDTKTVREMAALIPARIDQQIEPDGSQPEELQRTKALDYTEFNLRGLTEIAVLAQDVGIDLWGFEAEDGGSIRQGFAFALPYFAGEKDWPYQQITPPQKKHDTYAQSLRRCAIAYDDPRFEVAIDQLDGLTTEGRIYLDLIIPLPDDFPAH